jgi:hypothetical protein
MTLRPCPLVSAFPARIPTRTKSEHCIRGAEAGVDFLYSTNHCSYSSLADLGR